MAGHREQVDVAETLAISRAKELFGAEHANVQPHSGATANAAVLHALINAGDKILGLELAHGGMTMITVTHEMGFARKAADRVLFMADGRVMEDTTPEEFFSNPRTERAKDFLSKILSH